MNQLAAGMTPDPSALFGLLSADSFLIPTPGTTAVSLAALLGGIYRVKAFGAKGNGVKDDTAAIKDCFAAAGAVSNAVVYFDPGRYPVSAKVPITGTRMSILGAGRGATTIVNNVVGNPSDPLFEAQATNDYLLFEGLRVDGNALLGAGGNGHAIALMGTDADWLQFVTIRDCEFSQISGNGKSKSGASIPACCVYGYSVMSVRVDGSFFNNGNYSIRFDGAVDACNKIVIWNNNFDIMGAGIYCPDLMENMVIGGMNVFTQMTGNAIFLSNFDLVKIDGNRFKNGTATAVFMSTGANNSSALAITDNYFFNFTNAPAIEVNTRVASPRIEGNEIVFLNTVTAGVGIRINQEAGFTCYAPRIIGNRFAFGGTCTVADCIKLDNTSTPIYAAVIRGNVIGVGGAGWTVTRGITVGDSGIDCIGSEISNNVIVGTGATVTQGIRLGAKTFGVRMFDNWFAGCALNISNASPNALYPMWQVDNGAWITMPNIDVGLTQATVGAAGGAAAQPATPSGYMKWVINGVVKAVPYHNPV